MNLKTFLSTLLLMLLSIGVYAQNTKKTYVVIDLDGVATFFYNSSKPNGALPIQSEWNDANWPNDTRNSVTKVVFDASFKDYKPTSCAYWFYNFKNLTELSGIKENLNTANVKNMWCMFQYCFSLTTLDVSNFNTANVTDMSGMFYDCSSLTTLDVSNFNTANVTGMNWMFYDCKSLNAIFVGDNWSTASVTESSGMFYGCTKLYGGKGTAYNADITDATYAKVDGGKDAPGYFTKSGEPAFTTPVSDISGKEIGIKVWSFNNTIYIETLPDTKYTIIDLNGRLIKSASTKSTREQIKINKSGIVIVTINGASYKLSL